MLQNNLSDNQSAEERDAALHARVGIVFENYLASLIFSALLIFGCVFVYGIAADLFDSSFGFQGAATNFVKAFIAAALTFLVGFLAGIVLVVPLFRRTVAEDRKFIPLFGVCVIATCVVIVFLMSAMNKGQLPNIPSFIIVLLSASFLSVSFLKRMSGMPKHEIGQEKSGNLTKFG